MYYPLLASAILVATSIVRAQSPSSSTSSAVTIYGLLGQTVVSSFQPVSTSDYHQTISYTTVTTPGQPGYTQAAYNPYVYPPPPPPDPLPPLTFAVGVPIDGAKIGGLSIPHKGAFLGFSIEMSVVNQLIGKRSTAINVQFLNLANLLIEKAGFLEVRVGGNTQDFASVVDTLPDGAMIRKTQNQNDHSPTATPWIEITPDLIYMLANVSSHINVQWYLGLPFNDTRFRFQIAQLGEQILGDHLIGVQAGNEPDLWQDHHKRPEPYGIPEYMAEFDLFTKAYEADPLIVRKDNVVAPSVSLRWNVQDLWNAGFLEAYGRFLSYIAVEQYPDSNCAFIWVDPNNPQQPKEIMDVYPQYLSHNTPIEFCNYYLGTAALAQQMGKPLVLFETNSASCNGFAGISDAFVSTLWGIDHALQLAHSNFSSALFHFGGQNVTYNPFTAAPTNVSNFNEWSVGPVFYSMVFVSEVMGKSNTTQIRDMMVNDGNEKTVGYSVYENGKFAKMAFINYLSDPTGASDFTATVYVGGEGFGEGNGVPASVKVKYMLAPSVSEKDDITWANRTLGGHYNADGRWQGEENIVDQPCDQAQNMCQIKVPAPGAALVFFSDEAKAALNEGSNPATFTSSAETGTKNTISIDATEVAVSNGENGARRGQNKGGTSSGNGENGATSVIIPGMTVLSCLLMGAIVFRRMMV